MSRHLSEGIFLFFKADDIIEAFGALYLVLQLTQSTLQISLVHSTRCMLYVGALTLVHSALQ